MILVLFLPLSKYKYLDIVLAITVTITNVLVLIGTIRAIKNKIPFSRTFLLSSSFVLVTSFVDIFDYYTDYLSKRYFTVGFILFIIIQSFSYIIHNTQLYNQETALTVSLSDTLNDLKREESNFLSSHLRAHFLFNALNIISGYSVFEPDKAKEITTALTVYIKQLFEHDNLNELTSLKNEIDLLHAFGFIEEERFPNLNIEYNIPEDIPDIQVPSLILQPLLENAVNHGIRKKSAKEKGTVTITLKKANGFVNFSVRDDGAGCDENIIKQALEEPADGTYNSLFQIQSRLKKLYNQEIIYMSVPDIGTVISFKIPCS
jgi:LytS/YehU family sensor histidine kinase